MEIRTMKNPRSKRRGFTLVELLIVIAILLALSGIVLVGYRGIQKKADADLQVIQFDRIAEAIDYFELDLKRRPSAEEGLEALWNSDVLDEEDDQMKWKGPYLKEPIQNDVWDNEIVYNNPSGERGDNFYDLISFGKDGEEGTDDDVTNHDRHRDVDGEISEEFDNFNPADESGT
jgi:general secretion pathway protein G